MVATGKNRGSSMERFKGTVKWFNNAKGHSEQWINGDMVACGNSTP